jgi:hypothetical protein
VHADPLLADKERFDPIKIFIKDHELRAKAEVLYSHAMEEGTFRAKGWA